MNSSLVRLARTHMATSFDFQLSTDSRRAPAGERALAEAHARVAVLEGELSEFREGSPVRALNEAPAGHPVLLPPSALRLLEDCARYREASGGSFDCTAKSRAPGPASARSSAAPRVAWCADTGMAWRLDPGAHVGFGAIGKGFALDEARLILERAGFGDYLLSAGGSSIVISGFAAPGVPWTWGWSWGRDAEEARVGIRFRHADGVAMAIGVSGTEEQGTHLIDPVSGERPARLRSALVGHGSAAFADALSTALFVGGWEKGSETAGRLPAAAPALAVIESDGTPRWNGIFQKLWGAAGALGLALALASAGAPLARADEAVDLGALGLDQFTPYVVERNPAWVLLPLFSLALVALHLRKSKPRRAPSAAKESS